ncbi:MAG: hypothetical protein ACKODN_00945, partial [Actinomycetota bacterium]
MTSGRLRVDGRAVRVDDSHAGEPHAGRLCPAVETRHLIGRRQRDTTQAASLDGERDVAGESVTAFTALAASIRSEIRDTFGNAFTGDIALTVDARGFGGIPLTTTDQIAGLDGVAQATGVGFTSVRIIDPNDSAADSQPTGSQRGVFVQTINPATISGLFDLGVVEGDLSTLGRDGIFVEQDRAVEKGWSV